MKKEVDALRRLRHPRLVRFIGACVQPPLLLVVTEPLGGSYWGATGGEVSWGDGVLHGVLVLWLEPGCLFHPPFGDRPCFGWRV